MNSLFPQKAIPATSSSLNSFVTRRNTDQSLVAELKDGGYRALDQALTVGFAG